MHKTVKIITGSKWAAIAAGIMGVDNVAIVFGNTIHLHNCSKPDFLKNKQWVCHELTHVEQYATHGRYIFLWKYFIEHIRKGYANNKYEVEARNRENDINLLRQVMIE
mgnify:CR=1 FL=1